ncbi:hypothetical protein BABINDRAFT_146061 [Babjeviella inositovora NRRL Y-12698]|uniref:Uncharacterized protein n=1 Tax=Babjeviella inositovora NRRL Y-12698 TaxID=984486 RepID=A0A1E3QMQ0_9ASCO|nr:uncharacterized protein BABINDRAFT_146061 [Babjeviella inositovora NRRL Y-12698]ODQ78941.1 hypothetical protein BABINDRAFT_146061 [Babjeviella inositovora NRRL Y-12698]
MNLQKIPLFGHTFPLEISEKIISHLPLPTVAELMKLDNASITLVARKRYYSNIRLIFDRPPHEDGYSFVDDKVLSMKISEFEALVNSDTFDQLIIEELFIWVKIDIADFTFLHKGVFTKASSIIADAILEFDADQEQWVTFNWDWLPSLPLVQECIREIFVLYPSIDPKVPPFLSSLRKLTFGYDSQYREIDEETASSVVFPPNLQEFVSNIPWGSMTAYANLPSNLQKLDLDSVLEFSVETFNALNLPNLKDLVLQNIPGVTEINELFELPLLLESLKLESLNITNFERQKLPLRLKKLFITKCPLTKFCVDTFPDSLKELSLDKTGLPSSQIRMLKFPPGLVSLLVTTSQLTSLDFVNSLPGSLEILNLRGNSLDRLNKTDEDAATARSLQIKFPESLQKLELSYNKHLFTHYSPRNLIFPPSLKDLDLSEVYLSQVDRLDLPPGLNSLSLSGNLLTSVKRLNLPPGLTSLDLSSNHLVSVEELNIPLALTHLYLRYNRLQRFSKTLPESIQFLDFGYNQLKELVNFHLPVNCTEFEFSINPLQKLQISNACDPNLKLRDLCLSGTDIITLCDISPLPQCLTSLDISNSKINSLSDILLPEGLISLRAYYTKITSLEDVEFPPHLENLTVLSSQISSIANIHFPESLLVLILDDNKIASIDAVQIPPKLKILDFSRNAISTINELQLPESLEMLNLADQECDTLHNRVSTCGNSSESSSVSGKKGLSNLSGLTKLPPKLEHLDLANNSLSEQAIRHLELPVSFMRLFIGDNAFDDYYQWEREIKLTHPELRFNW